MKYFKEHLVKVILIIAIMVSIVICGYTILSNNKSTSSNNQTGFHQNSSFKPSGDMAKPETSTSGGENNQDQNTGTTNSNQQSPPNKDDRQGNWDKSNWMQGGGPGNATVSNDANSSNNSIYFLVYAVIFLCVSILGYFYFIKKKFKINPSNEKILIISLLAIGLLLRIALSFVIDGYSGDISLFKSWATSVSNGLSSFYTSSKMVDYPPLYMYILFVVGKLAKISVLSNYYILLLKLPSIIADVATAFIIYKVAKKKISLELSVSLAAFYVFNPAIFINSTLWGQVDSFFTLLIVMSVYLMSLNKLAFSSLMFTLAILMKPQGIIFLPVLFFELVRQKKIKNFIKAILIAAATSLIIILPFTSGRDLSWIIKLYSNTVSEYPYATMNAYNFFHLIGANLVKDSSTLFIFSYHTWGFIFIVLTTLFSWYIYIKGKDVKFAFSAALVQIAGVFILSVGMHERYLFPALALTILAFIHLRDRRILLLALGFSVTVYLNTQAVLFQTLNNSIVTLSVSFLNVTMLVYLVKILVDIAVRKKQAL